MSSRRHSGSGVCCLRDVFVHQAKLSRRVGTRGLVCRAAAHALAVAGNQSKGTVRELIATVAGGIVGLIFAKEVEVVALAILALRLRLAAFWASVAGEPAAQARVCVVTSTAGLVALCSQIS